MEQMNQQEEEVLDLREILTILRKRYLVIITITLAFLVTSGILSFFVMTPVFESKSVLLVTQAAPEKQTTTKEQGEGMEGLMNTLSKLPEMTVNTYVGQLQSEAVAQKVIQKLHLQENGYNIRSLAASVSVAAVKETNLIELKVNNPDPVLAAKIANTYTEEFLAFMSESTEQQMSKSVDFLEKQAEANGQKLKQAQATLNSVTAQPRGAEMLQQMITAKSADLSKYQSQLMQTNMEYQQALAGEKQAQSQLAQTPPTIKTTQETEGTSGKTGSGKPTLVEEPNPVYTELKSMINTKTVEATEKGAAVQSLQGIINQLNLELKNLQSELAQRKGSLDTAQKEVTRLEDTNTLLKGKIDETRIGSTMKFGETNLMVVSPASVPTAPVKPNKLQNMAIALLLGLMVSTGLAFVLNFLDNTVKSTKDVEEILGITVLGQIPLYRQDELKATRR